MRDAKMTEILPSRKQVSACD